MQAPDVREHIAVRYQALGFSPIPLDPGDKRPHATLLPNRAWGPYQAAPAPRELVRAWADMVPEPNWGLVCGQVSHGLYCGDCDDLHFAQWVLAHARDPLLRGACIVKSGSGKAHIWFLSPTRLESHVWKPRQGSKVGDVRGDGRPGALGSYMVVPPSIHPDTGQAYAVVAGGFDALPVIDNGEAFLAEVLAAYRQEVPENGTPPPPPTSRAVLTLAPEDRLRIQAHVRDLKLKGKIKDTILVQGNQTPGTRHWAMTQDDSRSGIDFAVVCELVRKGQTFEQVEEIFAATEIGNNRYLAKNIKHSTGYAYLKLTYDNAAKEVETQRRNSRVAKGDNFQVVNVTRLMTGTQTEFSLQIDFTDRGLQVLRMNAEDLFREERFYDACHSQFAVHPNLIQSHRGKHGYVLFAQAVVDMATDTVYAPREASLEGFLASIVLRYRGELIEQRRLPEDVQDIGRMGWAFQGTAYFRVGEVLVRLRSQPGSFKPADLPKVIAMMGKGWSLASFTWANGETETVLTGPLRATSAPRPGLPALPAPS